MPEMQPDLSHRAEMLLDFWFASESASKRDRLRDIISRPDTTTSYQDNVVPDAFRD